MAGSVFTRSKGPGGATSIQKILAFSDPLLSFKWVCTKLPFGFPPERVEAIDLPFLNIAVGDKTHIASGYMYYPSTHDISSFSMTLYEDSSASAMKFIWQWKRAVKDFKTGFYNVPGVNDNGYKKTIVVQLLDASNNPVITATLKGCWPADTGNFALNYTDTNRLTVVQTFSVDDQELQFHY